LKGETHHGRQESNYRPRRRTRQPGAEGRRAGESLRRQRSAWRTELRWRESPAASILNRPPRAPLNQTSQWESVGWRDRQGADVRSTAMRKALFFLGILNDSDIEG